MSKFLYTFNDELADIGFKISSDDGNTVIMDRRVPAIAVRDFENYADETVIQRVTISLARIDKICMRSVMYDEIYDNEGPDIVGFSAIDMAVIAHMMTPNYCLYRKEHCRR